MRTRKASASTPRPVSTRSSGKESSSDGVRATLVTGRASSAAAARSTPRPTNSRGAPGGVAAVPKSACRTISTRRQSRGKTCLYFSNQSAAAAATCGVAADVPSPSNRTASGQPKRAHGTLGV